MTTDPNNLRMRMCCGCKACKHMRSTQRIVLAETTVASTKGVAVSDGVVQMWNDAVNTPCEKANDGN